MDWSQFGQNILNGLSGGVTGLIGSGINALSQIITNRSNKENVEQTNAANLQLAQQQNQWNKDMWQMNADYNSPSAQLQRYKDAGLNPNLMYQNGADAVAATAPQSANMANQLPYQAINPNFEALQALELNLKKQEVKNDTQRVSLEAVRNNVLVKQLDLSIRKAEDQHIIDQEQANNLRQSTENLGLQSLELQAKIDGLGLDNAAKAIDLVYKEKFNDAQLQQMADKHHIDMSVIRKMSVDIANAYKEGKLLDQKYDIGGIEFQIKQSEQGIIAVEQSITEDNKDWNKWMGRVDDVIGAGSSIVGMLVNGLKGAKSMRKSR